MESSNLSVMGNLEQRGHFPQHISFKEKNSDLMSLGLYVYLYRRSVVLKITLNQSISWFRMSEQRKWTEESEQDWILKCSQCLNLVHFLLFTFLCSLTRKYENYFFNVIQKYLNLVHFLLFTFFEWTILSESEQENFEKF